VGLTFTRHCHAITICDPRSGLISNRDRQKQFVTFLYLLMFLVPKPPTIVPDSTPSAIATDTQPGPNPRPDTTVTHSTEN
jgi:hypothetical protein